MRWKSYSEHCLAKDFGFVSAQRLQLFVGLTHLLKLVAFRNRAGASFRRASKDSDICAMRAYPPFFRYDLISASISQFALLCKQKYGAAACLFGCPACPSGRKQKKPDGRGRMRAEQAPLYTRVPTWVWCTKTCNKRKSFFVCFRSGWSAAALRRRNPT